jgi:hypothetical protein
MVNLHNTKLYVNINKNKNNKGVSRIKHVSVLKSLKSLFKAYPKISLLRGFSLVFVCNGAFFFRMVSFFLCTVMSVWFSGSLNLHCASLCRMDCLF